MDTKTYIRAMKKYARGYTIRDVLSTDSNGANLICQNHGSTYIITIILIDKRKGLSTAIDSLSYDLPIQYKYRLSNEIDINSIAFIEDFDSKNEICYIRKIQETKLLEIAAQATRAVQKKPTNNTGWIPPYTPSSSTTTNSSSPQQHKPLIHIPVWLAAILVIFIGIGIYFFLTPQSIDAVYVKSGPYKTSYYVGETLDVSGVTLLLEYNNKMSETVTENFTCSPSVLSNAGTQEITVSYDGVTTTFYVNVTAVEISSLSIKSNPSDTSYFVGDTLDTNGLMLMAIYNDDTTETISSGFTCSPTKLTTTGNQNITVSYGGKTTKFNVNVAAVEVSSIAVNTKPNNTSYYVGETLNSSGLTLTAMYNNGETKTISSGFACSPTKLTTTGNQNITVSYGGKMTKFNVNVAAVEVSSISVKTNPSDTSYYVGETLNTSGLMLTAKYNDGSSKTITSGFSCSPTTLSSAGIKTITVSYSGKSTFFNVSVENTAVTDSVFKNPKAIMHCYKDVNGKIIDAQIIFSFKYSTKFENEYMTVRRSWAEDGIIDKDFVLPGNDPAIKHASNTHIVAVVSEKSLDEFRILVPINGYAGIEGNQFITVSVGEETKTFYFTLKYDEDGQNGAEWSISELSY